MPTALICTQADLAAELGHTLLWRQDIERHMATRLEDARMMAVAARPDVVLVDRDLPRSDKLVAQLREDPATRSLSLVVVARGDFDPAEVALLESGANAILRLPPGPEWDERLTRLMRVPARKDVRFPIQFAVEATVGPGQELPAMGLNLSVSGMLMESSVAVAIGDDLSLVLRLPGSDAAVPAAGRVVRQAGPTQFGIEFRHLDDAARERIGRCVDALAAS